MTRRFLFANRTPASPLPAPDLIRGISLSLVTGLLPRDALVSLLSSLLALLLASCAVPRPPSGGPADQTPPTVEAMTPEAGAVNVVTDEVRLHFSEWVDQGSFSRAFSVTPAPRGALRFSWRRRSVVVHFPEPLRENTTYVITLDTNLRDAHGVALKEPIIRAFSTGPEINKGRLAGRVLDATRGENLAGIDVFAYALPDTTAPDSLPPAPDYRTQSDDEGRFTFSYLNEQAYFVVALRDVNRNGRLDPLEAYAVPPRPILNADTVQADRVLPWLVARRDTIPPEVQRVRSLSSRRHALRFSESVRLTSPLPEAWLVQDSLAGADYPVRAVYLLPEDPRQVFFLTDSLAAVPHRVRPGAVADSSGNLVRPDTLRFTPSADPDTLRLRFLSFVPGTEVLAPGVQPGIRFNQPVPLDRLQAAVTTRDSTGQPWPFTPETEDGVTYRFRFEPPVRPGEAVTLLLDGSAVGQADTLRRFQRLSERERGTLSGAVTANDTTDVRVVELYRDDAQVPYATTTAAPNGAFRFDDLPEGTYRFRMFLDRDANGQWDAGTLTPYRPPEPVVWNLQPPAWRARWDVALPDTLRLSTF